MVAAMRIRRDSALLQNAQHFLRLENHVGLLPKPAMFVDVSAGKTGKVTATQPQGNGESGFRNHFALKPTIRA